VSTQTISSMHMNMNNINNARYIERVERKIQKQTRKYVSRFEPPLYVPAFIHEDFNYPLRIFPKGPSPRNYSLQSGVHNFSSLAILYTRRRHQTNYKAKRKYNLVITKISNITWWSQKITNKSLSLQEGEGWGQWWKKDDGDEWKLWRTPLIFFPS